MRSETGKRGEDAACGFLEKSGYMIIERNFRCQRGEVDIIAKKNDTLSFIEVKSRTSLKFGTPAEAVSKSKQRKICYASAEFISKQEAFDSNVAFDVIEVYFKGNAYEVNHIINAFEYSV